MAEKHIRAKTRFSSFRYTFLALFARDLRRLGIRASTQLVDRTIVFRADLRPLSSSVILNLLKAERRRRVYRDSEFIRRVRSDILSALIEGRQLDVRGIRPEIGFCSSPSDFALLRFCRLMQSVPAPRLLYRQIAVLVRDGGQKNRPLMGALGLCSPVYTLGCLDRLFGWRANETTKQDKLKACMQLAFCIAVPPYNILRAGRLMAALACSEEVALEFRRKYVNRGAPRLLAIVTTSATGLHSAVFNRLMLRPGGLYRRVGQTAGYSVVFYSKDTLSAARKLVARSDGSWSRRMLDRSIPTIKRALGLCGIPRECFVRLGLPKAVYLEPVAKLGTRR